MDSLKQYLEAANLLLAKMFILKGLDKSNIKAKTKFKLDKGKIVLSTVNYFKYIDKGRDAGKRPPVKVILDWIKRKRIKVPKDMTAMSFAFAVASSIAEKGVKGKDLTNPIQRITKNLIKQYALFQIKQNISLKS